MSHAHGDPAPRPGFETLALPELRRLRRWAAAGEILAIVFVVVLLGGALAYFSVGDLARRAYSPPLGMETDGMLCFGDPCGRVSVVPVVGSGALQVSYWSKRGVSLEVAQGGLVRSVTPFSRGPGAVFPLGNDVEPVEVVFRIDPGTSLLHPGFVGIGPMKWVPREA